MKKTAHERRTIDHNRGKIPDSKFSSGSLTGKFPIMLDGGKTTIFISDLSREAEIRERYELRKSSMANFYVKKPKI